jgi:sugar phosphate permease
MSAPETEIAGGLRRRWLYILPAVFVTYSLAYLDRANYGFGAAAGMAATLHITGQQSSLLSGLFFLGYFTFQIPGATLARKFKISRVVFIALVVWGSLAALTGVLHDFRLLALDRFLLGIAESLIFPVMLLLLTRWFTRAERSRANAILLLGNPVTVLWMSALTGLLIDRFGWQKTFIFEGIPSIAWGFLWIFLVRDRPSEAAWLPAEAADILEAQLAVDQSRIGPAGNVAQALVRPDVLLLSAVYFLWSVGVYGFVLWIPTIVRLGAVTSMTRTGLLSALPYLAAIPLMLFVSYLSDKTGKRCGLVWPFLFLGGICLLASFLLANRIFVFSFIGLVLGGACMYAPYAAFFAIIPDRLPANVTAEVMALINSCGALGAFVGSTFVGLLQAITGNARAGYMLMSVTLFVSGCLMLVLRDPPGVAHPAR